jgi:glycosyltransferase involved in cell wall biosynthesis
MISPEIAARVFFVGNLPYPVPAEHYKKADIFVSPAVGNDPSPLTIGEAMASGIPVISTKGGGIPELVVEGQTGLLVERGNSAALASAILGLLGNETLRRSMGRAGRQRALNVFSWDKITDKILVLYRGLMDEQEVAQRKSVATHA